MKTPSEGRWLLLIHNLPPKPAYFRVKIWRRLQGLGAIGIKNSVYALPRSEAHQEAFHWVCKEIEAGGGDATLCSAHFIAGVTDSEIQGLFDKARTADYESLMSEARQALKAASGKKSGQARDAMRSDAQRLRKRLEEIASIDFFRCEAREAVESLLQRLELSLRGPSATGAPKPAPSGGFKGRTWVTREGIHIDRMASAWLIRRFIDPKARFKFVPAKGYVPRAGEVRFDMFEAEFTHEGDLCTFEVLARDFAAEDRAVRALAEIVHDIDVRDEKHGRAEAQGVAAAVQAIHVAHATDEARLDRAFALLDDLYQYFERKRR